MKEAPEVADALQAHLQAIALDGEAQQLLEGWPALRERYRQKDYVYHVRGKEVRQPLFSESLSQLQIPRVALPRFEDPGEILRFSLLENLPDPSPLPQESFR